MCEKQVGVCGALRTPVLKKRGEEEKVEKMKEQEGKERV